MLKMMFILITILGLEFFNKKDFWKMNIIFFYFFFMFLILFMNLNVNLNFLNYLFLDYVSYFLILLSVWIVSLMLTASEKVKFLKNNEFLFKIMIYFLLVFLILTFMSNNFFLFYVFFESSLIPTLILILGWGYQPERINAGLYLLFYTLFASLPLLVSLIYLSVENFSMFMMNFELSLSFNMIYSLFYFSLVMAFLVKMPMFLVHLWLPKAHVEAPISGSMILAGVLLKLGGYGLMRILILLIKFNLKFGNWWISISLIGGVLISLNCLCQMDLKSLIAYSSVAHMSLVLGGIFTLFYWGVNGCFFMMIAHGLCSSGLFCLSNISYERMFSRMLLINKGLLNYLPSLTFWWFLLSSSNMSSPPSFNLLSEIMLINSLVSWSVLTLLFLMLILFFSASYSYFLYSYSQHGQLYSGIFCYSSGNNREFILLFFHWLPLNLMFMKSNFFLI